jgi:hypothetical protein
MKRRNTPAQGGRGGALGAIGRVALSVLLVASQWAGMIGAAAPTTAWAAQAEPDTQHFHNDHSGDVGPFDAASFGAYESTDGGTAAYCMDGTLHGPNADTTYTKGGWVADTNRPMAYALYHGWPNTTSICGHQLSDGEARAVTQIAVWLLGGYDLRDQGISDESKLALIGVADELVAKANAWDGTGPEAHGSVWYGPDDSARQRIAVPLSLGSITLTKASSNADVSSGNGCYSLAGATYGVFSADGTRVGSVTTDESGSASIGDLVAGRYYLQEETAPKGFALDGERHWCDVAPAQDTKASASDVPQTDAVSVAVAKLDAETGKASPLGSATLEGAEFEVRYYDNTDGDVSGTPKRTWTLRTGADGRATLDEAHKASGDALYTDSAGAPTTPLGTVSVTETKAPKGYLLSDASAHVDKVTADGTAEHVSTYVAPEVADHVARGDLSFSKVDEQTMGQLAGCAFLLTSETTGESHVLVTDENGMFDSAASWVPHTRGTDGNDAALSAAGSVDDEGLDASRGVWFGAGTKADDSLGALPYDTYDLRELPCAANAGHALTERTVTISRDRTDLDIGTVDDKQVSIRTEATDAATGTHESEAAAKQTIVDTVSYANLTPGKEYVLTGTLVDKATGKAIQSGGADVTATTTFTPEEPDGTAQVTFEFDGTATTGRTLVAFESLSQDGREVATHADVDDEGQTVTVPKVGTEATGKASGTHEEQATGRTEIVDTVSYANLVPGREYALTGTLVDKATGKAIQSGGADVTATTTFTPEKADGTAQVTFELDASALAGTTTVAFETLSREGREVATHADIEDGGQTVSLVGVGTKAADEATGTNEGTPADRVTIVDTVSYTGLTPGKEYVLTGTLMDASTGKAWQQDGADVTATTTLTPEKADGEAEVAFEIDGSALDGRTLVCFESLSRDGRQVAAHADISDAGQSVSYESPQTPPETPPATQEGLPKTGDDLPAVALLGLLGAGACAVAAAWVMRRRGGEGR